MAEATGEMKGAGILADDTVQGRRDAGKIFNVLFISVFSVMIGLGIVIPLLPVYAESLGAMGLWLGGDILGLLPLEGHRDAADRTDL